MPDRGRCLASRLGHVLVAALAVALACASPAAAAAAAAAATPAPPPSASPGGIGLRLLDAPVSAKDDPRARVYIVDHLAPGTVIERRIEVSNTTAAPAQIALYPAAATIDDGSFVGSADRTPNELSTWTTVTPEEPEVPAGGTSEATVRIAVPADAAPGEQYGVVWASASSAPGGGGVTQVSRVGIRLYVSVGPGGAPPSDFSIDALTAERGSDGTPSIVADVQNTGGRALDMNGTLELTDGPGGLSAGPFPATLGSTLAVGATEPVTITLDQALPAGPWNARLTLESGLVERSAEATVTFPDAGVGPAVPTGSGWPAWLYVTLAVCAVLLLAAAGAASVIRRHRPRHRRQGPELPSRQPVTTG